MKRKLFKGLVLLALLVSMLALISCLKSDKEDFTKVKVVLLKTDGVNILSKQTVEIKPGSDVSFNVKIADEYAYLGMTKNGVAVREEEGVPAKEFPIEGEYDSKNGVLKLKAVKYPTTVEMIVKPKSELYSFELVYNDVKGGAKITDGTKLTKGYKWMPLTDGRVKVTAYPNDTYSFNGWSVGAYIEDGGTVVSYEREIEYEITANTVLYANFSDFDMTQYKILYKANGGKVAADGKDELEVLNKYSAQYVMQQTLMSNGTFVRNGYVAVGYSTQAATYESSESIAKIPDFSNMGGLCKIPQSGILPLYVVWARETSASDFTFSNGKITKYNGNAGIVVIPEKIGGVAVTEIAAGAFKGKTSIKRLVIPRTVTTIKDLAFENCTNITEVVFFDSVVSVTDNAFKGCGKISSITLNSQRLPRYSGTAEGSFCIKYERLRNLSGKKLITVSGSSALYAINSQMLETEFKGYSVLNYGTNGNTSVLFYMDVIDNYLGQGDIVVHTPELVSSLSQGDNSITPRLFQGNEQCYDIFREVDMTKYKGFWTAFGKYQSGDSSDSGLVGAAGLEGKAYQLECAELNVYGDYAKTKTEPTAQSFGNATAVFEKNLINYTALNGANAEITKKGAMLLMSFAPRDIQRMHPNSAVKNEYDSFTKYCEDVLDYPVISNVGRYMIEHAYFYDSEYHCNDEGVRKVTGQLIDDLKRYIDEKIDTAPMFSNMMSIVYDTNGGKTSSGGTIYEVNDIERTQQFSMQQTLNSNDTFYRTGYIAVGYSTVATSFESVENVNKITGFSNMGGVCEVPKSSGTLKLYVVWAKESAASDFEYHLVSGDNEHTECNGKLVITKYKGSSEIVVIPEYINGKEVGRIAAGAFKNSTSVKRLVIPKSVLYVEDLAFENCSNLNEVVFFDSMLYVSDNSFKGCSKLSTITLNAKRLPGYSGSAEGSFSLKYMRVRTLRSTKKIIVLSGSSTMHSLNSAVMENSFPGYSVINYGTNISNCSLFFLDVISNYTTEGDLIVHAPEMSSTVTGDNVILPKLFRGNEQCYDIFREVDMTNYTNFWTAFSQFQVGSSDTTLTPRITLGEREYQRYCKDLNMYGDWAPARPNVTYTAGKQTAGFNAKGVMPEANAARLNWVNGKIKAKGGILMMSFSVRDIMDMNPNNITDAKCNEYTKYFQDRLDYAVISNVKTYFFEHELMYNSSYHPNDEGAALRTSLLTADIKRYLNYLSNPEGTFSAPML